MHARTHTHVYIHTHSTAGSYTNIGNVYKAKGDFDHALEYYDKGLSIFVVVHGENHPG